MNVKKTQCLTKAEITPAYFAHFIAEAKISSAYFTYFITHFIAEPKHGSRVFVGEKRPGGFRQSQF